MNLEESLKIYKERWKTNINKLNTKILNRRKNKLDELLKEGIYFSEESIKIRDPILYQIYVGSNCQKTNKSGNCSTLSKFLFDELDIQTQNDLYQTELAKEANLYNGINVYDVYVNLYLVL